MMRPPISLASESSRQSMDGVRAPTDEAVDAVNDWSVLLHSLQLELEQQGMTRNHLIAQTLRRLARMGWSPSSDEMRAAMEGAVVRAAARMTESDVRNSLWSLATLEWRRRSAAFASHSSSR